MADYVPGVVVVVVSPSGGAALSYQQPNMYPDLSYPLGPSKLNRKSVRLRGIIGISWNASSPTNPTSGADLPDYEPWKRTKNSGETAHSSYRRDDLTCFPRLYKSSLTCVDFTSFMVLGPIDIHHFDHFAA